MEENDLKIYLDIQKPYYYPGEQILGSILIEFFNSINCSKILIISKGKQYVKINRKNISHEEEDFGDSMDEEDSEENEDDNKKAEYKSIWENIDEIKTIFKYEKKLKINNNYISKGKYNFPFEIDIPENIPGSFLYIDNNIYIEIIYTIKIKIDNINYVKTFPIIIRQKEKLFNYQKSNDYNKILGECCWERGQTNIKVTSVNKYSIAGDKIKLNILINNENSGMQGTPLNIEMYRKIIIFPKSKIKRMKLTTLVGKSKGSDSINPRKNFNEDISFKMNHNKIIALNKEKTKAFKYFKNREIIELLTPSMKTDLIICEYDIYIESQFVGWFKEELGVFNKILVYPPEKGILEPDIENISKEFLNSLVNKKIFLNGENNNDEVVIGKNKNIKNDNNKEKKEHKKNKKEVKDKIKNHKNKNKENYYGINDENIDPNIINNIDDINKNFNINDYQKYEKNFRKKEIENDFEDIDSNDLKKKLGRDYFNEHEFNDEFLDNTLDE